MLNIGHKKKSTMQRCTTVTALMRKLVDSKENKKDYANTKKNLVSHMKTIAKEEGELCTMRFTHEHY